MEKSIGDIKEDQQVVMEGCENVEQSNQNQAKRKRGRPRGSGKLQMIASLGELILSNLLYKNLILKNNNCVDLSKKWGRSGG